MGITIGETTQGISKSGLENYQAELHKQAITETINLLREIGEIRTALRAGWQGEAEENFEANLETKIKEEEEVIQGLKQTLDAEFAALEATWAEQDGQMVERI